MKQFVLVVLIGVSSLLFSQDIQLEVHQNSQKIKNSKNEVLISQAPFSLVYKFKEPFSAVLVAGNDSIMKSLTNAKTENISDVVLKSGFGGADGYFNEDLTIRAWNTQICTSIFYEDDEHHSFDSLYRKGKWIYGVRTIERLSTPENTLYIEGWKQQSLIVATATKSSAVAMTINLKETPRTITDVRGKEFIEEGESTWQDGCEGCGNLGSFHFLMNAKNVDFLLSGSDTGSFGTYTQSGNQINVADEYFFTVSEDGKSITDHKSKTVYTIHSK